MNPQQRNPYKGAPPRPWIRLALLPEVGPAKQINAVADTGNPCALIVGSDLLKEFGQGQAPGIDTNFGRLDGGWLRVQIPEIGFDSAILAYGSNEVLSAVSASHEDFMGLCGLPLLRLMEFGGNSEEFWIRPPLAKD